MKTVFYNHQAGSQIIRIPVNTDIWTLFEGSTSHQFLYVIIDNLITGNTTPGFNVSPINIYFSSNPFLPKCSGHLTYMYVNVHGEESFRIASSEPITF